WFVRHGNVFKTLQTLDDLESDLEDLDSEGECPELKKLLRAIHEFDGYIQTNRAFIPNYGKRYRYGEIISTAFVESTVNYVLSKRFVKKQQMRWTREGAHLLLQIRLQVINEDWRNTFCHWYPGMEPEPVAEPSAA
ncbi:MAG: ISKra4 family transposase, partial [Aggregatilineales bacterium]